MADVEYYLQFIVDYVLYDINIPKPKVKFWQRSYCCSYREKGIIYVPEYIKKRSLPVIVAVAIHEACHFLDKFKNDHNDVFKQLETDWLAKFGLKPIDYGDDGCWGKLLTLEGEEIAYTIEPANVLKMA